MGQAHLVLPSVTGLGREPVRDPDLGLCVSKEGRDHGLAAGGRDDVAHRRRARKHPLPMGFSLDPRRGSSLAMTGVARESWAAMDLPSAAKGTAARASMLAMAPCDSVKPNSPCSISTSRL